MLRGMEEFNINNIYTFLKLFKHCFDIIYIIFYTITCIFLLYFCLFNSLSYCSVSISYSLYIIIVLFFVIFILLLFAFMFFHIALESFQSKFNIIYVVCFHKVNEEN